MPKAGEGRRSRLPEPGCLRSASRLNARKELQLLPFSSPLAGEDAEGRRGGGEAACLSQVACEELPLSPTPLRAPAPAAQRGRSTCREPLVRKRPASPRKGREGKAPLLTLSRHFHQANKTNTSPEPPLVPGSYPLVPGLKARTPTTADHDPSCATVPAHCGPGSPSHQPRRH